MNNTNTITSIDELLSKKGQPVTSIKIADNLTDFPEGILYYAETLEILDLSNNQLTELPESIASLTSLKILFASNNLFTTFPTVLYRCCSLKMIGFKANKIKEVPEQALPINTRWLILTDNLIEKIPDDIGRLQRLQKCMLAGNHLKTLPDSLQKCQALQLLRISANRLQQFPTQVLALPNLAWLALAGNPFNTGLTLPDTVPKISTQALTMGALLGEGASGLIYQASHKQKDYAVKIFKGSVTSDGYPEDELLASLRIPTHANLVKVIAQIDSQDSSGVLMELIPARFGNLGLPPSLDSCTRDVFDDSWRFDESQVAYIIQQMLDAIQHIHRHHFIHGDIYAHNVLVDERGQLLFGDMGAASYIAKYDDAQQAVLLLAEYRAMAYFIEDVLHSCANFEIAQLPKDHALCQIDKLCKELTQSHSITPTFLDDISRLLAT